MRKPRPKRGTQRQTVEAVQLFGRDDQREWFEGRVVELVRQGKTPGAAERQAARELLSGRRPE